jgi:hypothetical protein
MHSAMEGTGRASGDCHAADMTDVRLAGRVSVNPLRLPHKGPHEGPREAHGDVPAERSYHSRRPSSPAVSPRRCAPGRAWRKWFRKPVKQAVADGQVNSIVAHHGIARQNGAYYPVIMRTISVKLPDELLAHLAREAKARRVTKSSLVRESLEKGLHPQPSTATVSCYDLAHDLAGTVKGLPKDLADNPKYMDGFGR